MLFDEHATSAWPEGRQVPHPASLRALTLTRVFMH
jgi:hypothetical protein